MKYKNLALPLIILLLISNSSNANEELYQKRCQKLSQKAFHVMLSHQQESLKNKIEKPLIKNISNELDSESIWSQDVLDRGLYLLISDVKVADSLEEKVIVSENFEAIVHKRCQNKTLGPLQQFVSLIEIDKTFELNLSRNNDNEVALAIKSLLERVEALESKSLKQERIVQVQIDSEFESINKQLKATSEVLQDSLSTTLAKVDLTSEAALWNGELSQQNSESVAALRAQLTKQEEQVQGLAVADVKKINQAVNLIKEELSLLQRQINSLMTTEQAIANLDERLYFAEQSMDSITTFRQETNRKLDQLATQIRNLEY